MRPHDLAEAERLEDNGHEKPKKRRGPRGLEIVQFTPQVEAWVRKEVQKLLAKKPKGMSLEAIGERVRSEILSRLKNFYGHNVRVTQGVTIPVLDFVNKLLEQRLNKKKKPDGLYAEDLETIIIESRGEIDEGDRQNIQKWLTALRKVGIITKTKLKKFYETVLKVAGERSCFSVQEFKDHVHEKLKYPLGVGESGLNVLGKYLVRFCNMPPSKYREFTNIEIRANRGKLKPRTKRKK
jgi:DNA-binding transcriptional ArsR family regulator